MPVPIKIHSFLLLLLIHIAFEFTDRKSFSILLIFKLFKMDFNQINQLASILTIVDAITVLVKVFIKGIKWLLKKRS
jgi:hypothetical protein